MLAAATRLGPYEILAPLGAGGMVYPELARSWAWNNRLAEVDWGERAVTETARVTRTVIEAFYGIPPRRSYFTGASTGGRMAAMEAQRHPEDFDGIVSAAPALDKRCDACDGLEDGIVSDPSACDFVPSSLACRASATADCLTPAEVRTLEAWYAGPINSRGERFYPGGIPRGSEAYWCHWLTRPEAGGDARIHAFCVDLPRYMAFPEDPATATRWRASTSPRIRRDSG